MKRQFDASKMRDWRTPRAPRSAAQEAATARAFKIVRLRGLWFLVGVLDGWRARSARCLIDDNLKALGAEPQTARRDRERQELFSQIEKENLHD